MFSRSPGVYAFKLIRLLAFALSFCLPAGTVLAADATVNKIAAVVNGEMITLHTLRANTQAELARLNISREDPRAARLMRNVLDAMISDILLRQEAAKYKFSVADSEVEAEIRNIMQSNNMTAESFEASLAREGATLEQIRERIRNTIIRNRMLSLMISRKIVITAEEIAEYYNAHQEQFSGQKYAEFSVIVFLPSVQARKIYEMIKSRKLAFDDAARQYSADPSARNGGYVGRVPWNSLPENVRKAFSALPEGGLTPLLVSEGHNVLFLLKSMGEGEPQTLEQASGQIEAFLRQPRMEERFKEYTKLLRSKAVVDIRL
ncbi:MAG: SurA N-terminal domain-containing protein [Deltaproteobacteria bacterium]|jgi:peptidyl-prolyl cis-trans isomerase SurA|nr:SurA N-terminal domain-containing protein [Deltaproteobacteria bacterium]